MDEAEERPNDVLSKIHYKNEHGLSREEHKWFSDHFGIIELYQKEQLEAMEGINGKLTFIVVVIIIGIVVSFLRGCL
jgi:hypothetical protein